MSNIKIDASKEVKQENVSLNDVMDLLKKQGEEIKSLRDENQTLTQKLDPWFEIRQSREKYEWPRKFSYWLIDWKPVVGWKTVSDQQYQNPYTKKWEAKQEIEVHFYNWKKIIYDITPFWNMLVRSEKTFPKEIIQKGAKTFYVFELEWEAFEVEQTFINP